MTEKLFEEFVRTGLYLRSWSPKTAKIYREAFQSFQRYQQSQRELPETLLAQERVQFSEREIF
jgi:hypothetical protein